MIVWLYWKYQKTFVFINTAEERIDKFAIGYTNNPKLHADKVFKDQAEKFLKDKFHQITMKGIQNLFRKYDTCVIALLIFMRLKQEIQQKCIEG